MDTQILEKLKDLRLKKGLSELDVARKLNIEEQPFKKIEKGTNKSWHKYFNDLLNMYDSNPVDFYKDIKGQNFVNLEVKDNATGNMIIDKLYVDKPIVKNLLNDKDRIIMLQDQKIKDQDKIIQNLEEEIKKMRSR